MKPILHLSVMLLLNISHTLGQSYEIKEVRIPTYSIDSLFRAKDVENGELYNTRLRISMENVLKVLAKEKIIEYYSNYKLKKKVKTDYSISLKMGFGENTLTRQEKSYFVSGRIWDKRSDSLAGRFDCASFEIAGGCFCDEGYNKDSICEVTEENLTMGGTLTYFVPMQRVLFPIEVEGEKLLNFSIDEFITPSDKQDKVIADNLTHMMNNMLVYRLYGYNRPFFKNISKYKYINNYMLGADKKQKADFVIGATLKEAENGQYRVDFNFKSNGKAMNLVAPDRQVMSVILDKKRLKEGDYSEAMRWINPSIIGFILRQVML